MITVKLRLYYSLITFEISIRFQYKKTPKNRIESYNSLRYTIYSFIIK